MIKHDVWRPAMVPVYDDSEFKVLPGVLLKRLVFGRGLGRMRNVRAYVGIVVYVELTEFGTDAYVMWSDANAIPSEEIVMNDMADLIERLDAKVGIFTRVVNEVSDCAGDIDTVIRCIKNR